MPRHNFFEGGQWNAVCDCCGFTFKSGELQPTWDKYMACRLCWYPRNPQDFIKGIPDDQAVPWSRPAVEIFTATGADDPGMLGGSEIGAYALGGP